MSYTPRMSLEIFENAVMVRAVFREPNSALGCASSEEYDLVLHYYRGAKVQARRIDNGKSCIYENETTFLQTCVRCTVIGHGTDVAPDPAADPK